MALVRQRLAGVIAALAFASAFVVFAAGPASAQTCPGNSSQATCACPTSGSGTTCFGGQLYRGTDSTCQNDSRPCAANQQFSCASAGCTCNTAAFPCGGCTAASSSVGGACSSPTGGQYTNVCGACACPAGTTLCASGNRCVTNRACPSGTTWDPCSDTCGTPNVLLSPTFTQNGFIDVAGDWINRAGNFRLDYSNGAGVGDFYIASGKSLRVDGAGVTNLNVANYGAGGTGLNVTFPATSQLCFGAACRSSWPAAADFNPTYVNVSGSESMTGPLSITGAGTNLLLSGPAGAAGVPKMQITAPGTNEGLRIISAADASPLNIRNSANTADLFRVDQTGALAVGSVPWGRLSGFPAACGAGQYVSGVGGTLTCSTPAVGMGGSGTANYHAKFTGATTIGNSLIYDTGTNVGVNTTAPNARFQVESDTYDFPSGSQQRRFTTSLTGAQMFMNDSSGVSIMSLGTGPGSDDHLGFNLGGTVPMLIQSNGNVGIGTTTPGSYKVNVSSSGDAASFGSGSSWFRMWTGGNSRLSLGDGAAHEAGFIAGGHNGSGLNVIDVAGCTDGGSCPAYTTFVENGNVGIGTRTPGYRLDVQGGGGYNVDLRVTGRIQTGDGTGNNGGMWVNNPGSMFMGAETSSTLGFYNNGAWRMDVANNGDMQLNNKHAFRSTDSWLRLNQDSAFSSGTHTPGNFAPGALNVGGANGWGNPGGGNAWIAGSTTNYGNLWVGGTVTSNYYASWWTADAWNGGYWQGATSTTTSNHMCVLLKTEIRGSAGGRCDTWQGGDGYWWRSAWSAGTGEVHCAWNCFKYR